jgi:hypothetical protein
MIPREYRRRWGIETTFRKVKEVFPMTTSPLPAIRLAHFMTATILYNLWQLVNMMLATDGGRRTSGHRVTMPFMITVLCAHLNGRALTIGEVDGRGDAIHFSIDCKRGCA